MEVDEVSNAVGAVLRRLGDLRQLWHQTRSAYFEPDKFRLGLQSTIATARTVTFILQSNKAAIPEFKAWYEGVQSRFKSDPIMRWAVNARNKIEKQGDLATLSQVKVELVASYAGHPHTAWTPANVFASLGDIRRTIPAHLLDEHVLKHGVLCVQRRWVDAELPDHEILDALAHVYGQLAQMVVELHRHIGADIPRGGPDKGEHLLLDTLPDGRLKSMEVLEAERTIYVAVSTGREMEIGRIPRGQPSAKVTRLARKRYVKDAWAGLKDARSFREMAEVFFAEARRVMLRDGYHMPIMLLWKDLLPVDQIQAWSTDRRAKYMMMRDAAARARQIGANGVTFISEAWTARREDLPESGFAAEAQRRGEALVMFAANADGEMFSLQAKITRQRIRRHKVKALGPTEHDEGQIMTLAPFLEIWGKLDLLADNEDEEAAQA
ncbi:hypothetical protein [Brevundimonas sp. A19_0]|uniref:hypothetical protein n=1 Tax=Brevundimonas sp. A19_0 TaxID=2821087 RepID=UPI001ADD0835|nr:hypothetical protein [Brevundimonas sp. A19_0]MBO9501203.1 hypothetical protein [Brevundimonas sp. A19_0]